MEKRVIENQSLATDTKNKQKKMGFDNRPCFFRIFFPQFMAQQMRIPPQFVKDILKKVTASRAILTGPSGGRWAMEILKTLQEVFLGDGWQGFVRDNLMEELDFLVFKYDGDMCFTVEIFDKSGLKRGMCQPKDVTRGSGSGLKRGMCEWKDETCGSGSGLKRGICQPKDATWNSGSGLRRGMCQPKDATRGSGSGLKRGRCRLEDATLDDSGRGRNQGRPEVYWNKSINLQKKLASECQPGVGALKSREIEENHVKPETVDVEIEQEDQPIKEHVDEEKEKVIQKRSGPKHGRTKAPDHRGTDIFKSGILPIPINPYFVTKIRPKRRDELYIPLEVLKDFSIEKLPEQATLRDSCGRTWSSKLSTWADNRKFYIGGWASFCRVNLVGDDDLCLCEFVKGDQEDLVIQLQVVATNNNAMNHRRDQQLA